MYSLVSHEGPKHHLRVIFGKMVIFLQHVSLNILCFCFFKIKLNFLRLQT